MRRLLSGFTDELFKLGAKEEGFAPPKPMSYSPKEQMIPAPKPVTSKPKATKKARMTKLGPLGR